MEEAAACERVQTIFTSKENLTSEVLDELVQLITKTWLCKHQSLYANDEHLTVEMEQFIDNFFQQLPLLFVHRYGALLKQATLAHVLRLHDQQQPLVTIQVPSLYTESLTTHYAYRYREAFHQWLADDTCYSIIASYHPLKQSLLPLVDDFVLHLFILATCKRIKNDNVVCVSVTGVSTIGKSTLIENPLENISFNTVHERGVNRFNIGSKSVMLLHDADPRELVSSKDGNIYRCVARAEVCKVKTFGNVTTLPPVFLMLTSNYTIHTHTFPLPNTPLKRVQDSILVPHLQNSKKQIQLESRRAMHNRFLEILILLIFPMMDDHLRDNT